jgi:hypothetical protein
MCIITGYVESVKGTKIFAMPASDHSDRQLVVYKNEVASIAENLMILPVPYPDTIQFERVSKILFKHLEQSMIKQKRYMLEIGCMTRSVLPVLSIGSYRVSIVPTVDAFSRLDSRIFSLPPDLEHLMGMKYSHLPFGFLCCVLKAGVQDYEPLAYSHKMWKPNMLFIPTLHYHPGEDSVKADWDHEVYTLRTGKEANHCDGWPAPQNKLRTLPKGFEVDPQEPVHCWMKEGVWDNIDLELPIIS